MVCPLQGVRPVNADPRGAGTHGGGDEDSWEGVLAGLLTTLHYILDPEAATHTYNPNVQEIGGRKNQTRIALDYVISEQEIIIKK